MRILSLDGGGYLGLATASFLSEAERHFGVTCHDQFDFFCGTSTGAIIALGLASGMRASDLVDLYKGLGPRVFVGRRLKRGVFSAKYSTRPLRDALDDAFGDATLNDLQQQGKRVLIPAFCLTSGRPRVFKSDHAPILTAHGRYRLVDVALASSAAPVYLPLVSIADPANGRRETFCDGGVLANHPALLGFVEAVQMLSVPPSDIRLLSISTPRKDLRKRPFPSRALNRGILGWKKDLASTFIDANSMIADQLLKRLVQIWQDPGPTYERIALPNPHCIEMDDATAKATAAHEHLGVDVAQQDDQRKRLAVFFTQVQERGV